MQEVKDAFKFLLAILSSAISASGFVLLTGTVLSLLPENLTLFFKVFFGLLLIIIGTLFAIIAGKKVHGLS